MKGILLTGLLTLTPVFGHSTLQTSNSLHDTYVSNVHVQADSGVQQLERQLLRDMSSIDQLFQSNQPDLTNVLQQMNQIFNDANLLNKQLLDQTVVRRAGIHRLPRQHLNRQIAVGGIQLSAGDRNVTNTQLKAAANLVKTISIPILTQTIGASPAGKTHIVLFSSQDSYGNALLQAGIRQNQLPNIVSETGGLTVGSDIWIPLYNLQDESDLANVLTHELTHVVINQKRLGDVLPTWINEGIAWHDGLLAQAKLSSQVVQNEFGMYDQQLQQAAAQGQLLPLTASETDILQAGYNVEWEDYLAVRHLLQTYGSQTFQSFLNDIPKYGVDQSFFSHYKMSKADYEKSYYQKLDNGQM
ncbi:hypothetical protein LSG31_19155 [Fodinisporobacter ferrooxydans]|uniref:Peptidase MA-like domain-containing protein n=1 Tax=Fodinisporobacter ferrooxydans TaxID=2901836 RepID=A0ABY4CHL5_9BACL|nr:hypothetical protein LSG31_19155 [Alicyclobacillaceae bacterium MYW30-H2]